MMKGFNPTPENIARARAQKESHTAYDIGANIRHAARQQAAAQAKRERKQLARMLREEWQS